MLDCTWIRSQGLVDVVGTQREYPQRPARTPVRFIALRQATKTEPAKVLVVVRSGPCAGWKLWLPESELMDLFLHTPAYSQYANDFAKLKAQEQLDLIWRIRRERLAENERRLLEKQTKLSTARATTPKLTRSELKDLGALLTNNPTLEDQISALLKGDT